MAPDAGARYDETIELDLSTVEPLIALPHMPDRVVPVREVERVRVDQVCIGSCTNSSYADLALVGAALRGRKVHPEVSLTISPGSRMVLEMIAADGSLEALVQAGARVLECACGPCIGVGQAPATGAVTLRTFNRNFEGRTGTTDALCHLCSPQTAVASALAGRITDPRSLGQPPVVPEPATYQVNDNLLVWPPKEGAGVQIVRGPNIKPVPTRGPLPESLRSVVLLRVGDNITTDHIMPAGSKVLRFRSNIPAISDYVFEAVDPSFARRAREKGGGVIVAGENYGQGSSREHAALAPMHLGVLAVIAKSFARIHRSNLINFGILPLVFADPRDYDRVRQDDVVAIEHVWAGLEAGRCTVSDPGAGISFDVLCDLSAKERQVVKAGGRLNMISR
jgi:aconitate hydratase